MADLESWTVGLQQGGPLYFHSASSLQIANLALFRNKINIYSLPLIVYLSWWRVSFCYQWIRFDNLLGPLTFEPIVGLSIGHRMLGLEP